MGEIMFDEFHCITIFVKHNITIFVKHNLTIFVNDNFTFSYPTILVNLPCRRKSKRKIRSENATSMQNKLDSGAFECYIQ